LSGETEWVEFKRNYHSAQMIGEYISTLTNAACLKYKPKAYLLYGIQDETHEVVGTSFDPYTEKGKGSSLSRILLKRTIKNGKVFLRELLVELAFDVTHVFR